MASGHFVESNEMDETDRVNTNTKHIEEQVLMGTDTGAIYIMANFQVNSFINSVLLGSLSKMIECH